MTRRPRSRGVNQAIRRTRKLRKAGIIAVNCAQRWAVIQSRLTAAKIRERDFAKAKEPVVPNDAFTVDMAEKTASFTTMPMTPVLTPEHIDYVRMVLLQATWESVAGKIAIPPGHVGWFRIIYPDSTWKVARVMSDGKTSTCYAFTPVTYVVPPEPRTVVAGDWIVFNSVNRTGAGVYATSDETRGDQLYWYARHQKKLKVTLGWQAVHDGFGEWIQDTLTARIEGLKKRGRELPAGADDISAVTSSFPVGVIDQDFQSYQQPEPEPEPSPKRLIRFISATPSVSRPGAPTRTAPGSGADAGQRETSSRGAITSMR